MSEETEKNQNMQNAQCDTTNFAINFGIAAMHLYLGCQRVFFPCSTLRLNLSGEAAIVKSGKERFFSRSSRSRLRLSIFAANNRKKTLWHPGKCICVIA